MDAAELCLTWDDHHNALLRVFEELLQSNTLVDCTIAAEGQYLKAHKVVLSACSPYFQMLFSQENEKNPIVVLKDMKFQELKAVIEFVYRGQVKVLDTELEQFLGAAESLQIRGLANHQKKKTPEHIASNDPLPQERSPSPPVPRKRRRTSPPQVREEDIVSQRGIVHNDNNTVDIGIGEVPVDIHVPSSAVPSSSSAAVSTSSAAPRKYSSNRDQTRTRQPSYPPLVEVLSDTETVIKTEPEPDPEPEPMTEVFVAETKNEEYSDEMQLLDSGDGNAGPSSSDVSAHQSISQFPASSPVFDTAEDPFLTSQIGEQSGAQDFAASAVEMEHLKIMLKGIASYGSPPNGYQQIQNLGNHFPVEGNSYRRCYCCRRKMGIQKRTKTICVTCKRPLCKFCFIPYHSQYYHLSML